MEIGSGPMRWDKLKHNTMARQERISRMNITRLDYLTSGEILRKQSVTFEGNEGLHKSLNDPEISTLDKRNLRLFIVEDLSRDIIEGLGARYDSEPQFFQ